MKIRAVHSTMIFILKFHVSVKSHDCFHTLMVVFLVWLNELDGYEILGNMLGVFFFMFNLEHGYKNSDDELFSQFKIGIWNNTMHSNKRNIDESYKQEVSYSFIFLVGKEINSNIIYRMVYTVPL